MTLPPLPRSIVEPIVDIALREDFGVSGDLSSSLLIPETAKGALRILSREDGVISGMQAAELTFLRVDERTSVEVIKGDGREVHKGDTIARLSGPSRSLLTAERVALNFLGRMSGIATLTQTYVGAVEGTSVRVAATRKTTPGLRALEKHAVRCGGGYPHRESLAAAIMIKDNHIALAGGVDAALKTLRDRADHMTKISVEVDTLDQLRTLLPYEPDVILLDNMGVERLTEAVALVGKSEHRRPILEASGGINLDTVRDIAETGIDVISIGALTHSAPNFDIGMDH